MPSVEELLSVAEADANTRSAMDSRIEIDADTRIIRMMPQDELFGVESDEKSERKYFKVHKIVGNGVDLSKLQLRINYQNASKIPSGKDMYIVTDATVYNDEWVYFSWELSRKVTQYKGNIYFIVCAVKADSKGNITNEWNTTLAEGKVLEGLEVETSQEQQYQASDYLEQLKQQLLDYSKEIKDTFPSDYTQMQDDIGSLKGDLATLKTTQDNVVDAEKTAFFDVQLLSANRFNWEEPPYIDNMLFTGDGEKTSEHSGYYISQFMRIEGGKTYYQNLNSPICLYDNAHKYIRTVKYNESPFIAEENAKYARCSVQRSVKASRYISEVKQIGTQAGYVTPFTGDKIVVNDKRLEKALFIRKEEIIKTVYGDNRFDVTEPHFEDGKIIQYGNIIDRTGYFISHLMKIKPKTTYYKNEAGDGIFYDEKMNIVGLSNNEGKTFTSPDNAFYYRCSLSNGIAKKFYVSTVDKISSFGDTYELEQPAKSAVEKVVKDLKGTGESVIEKRISKISDSLNGTSPIEKAIVTFIDDDGAKVINTIVLPYLKETKTKLGVAIITGAIGSTDYYMTENELLECHESGYVETLSHCHNQYTALTSLSEDELHYQYATSKEWLESHGLEAESFVYPQNTTNKLVRKVAREYYKYCFTGISFNSEKYLDHSLINRIAFGSFESYNPEISGISDKDSLDYYKVCVDMAIENGQWLVFNTHFGIETSHTTNAQLTLFKNLVDYIKSKGIEIVFPSEGFALKRNIISFGDKDETHLFLGNNDFDSRNIIGSRITAIGEKTNQTPITEYKSGIISISTIDYAHGHGGKFPADQGILETYRDASWLGYSYQKFTELKTCKQYMRFWDADATNSWLSWVSIN